MNNPALSHRLDRTLPFQPLRKKREEKFFPLKAA
jgi:hypothetical protein